MSREKITVEWLENEDACREDIELFKKIFPRGCVASRANLIKAAKGGLPVWWLVDCTNIFTDKGCNNIYESLSDGIGIEDQILDAKTMWNNRHHIKASFRAKFGIK